MIFNLLIVVATGIVAFFHYVQGLFSATISAILVAIAAVVAVGFHEQVAQLLIGKAPDYAASIALVALFAVIYLALRFAFDWLVPGNVRFPVLVDKIGAGVMGVVAGLLATGVLAVAAQALPLGPAMGLFSRYNTADKAGSYSDPGGGQTQDIKLNDVMVSDGFDPVQESHLILQQDELLLGMVRRLSDGGSLEGAQAMPAIHPDYLTELFGQRLGIQVGARHTIVSNDAKPLIKVTGVYTQDRLTQIDGDLADLHARDQEPSLVLLPDSGQSLLIVRAVLNGGKELSDDPDGLLRLSPGSVRLTAGSMTAHGADYKDYYPVALLDPRGVAVACRVDDFLLAPTDGPRTLDFIFVVDNDYAFTGEKPKVPFQMVDGSFLTIKRYGIADLSNSKVDYGPPPNIDRTGVLRPEAITLLINRTEVLQLKEPPGILAPGAPTAPGTMLGNSGLKYLDITSSNQLPNPIDVHGDNARDGEVEMANIRGDYSDRQWKRLRASIELNDNNNINTSDASTMESAPDNVGELMSAPREIIIQLHCQVILPPNARADQAWGWTKRLAEFTFVDRDGAIYSANGVWARGVSVKTIARRVTPQPFLSVSFGGDALTDIPQTGVPSEMWLAFRVPTGRVLRELRLTGNTVLENLKIMVK